MEFTAERLREMAAVMLLRAKMLAYDSQSSEEDEFAKITLSVGQGLLFGADALEECARLRGALAEARKRAIEEAMIEVAGALDELLKSDPQERFPVEARIIGEAVRALRALLAAPPPSTQSFTAGIKAMAEHHGEAWEGVDPGEYVRELRGDPEKPSTQAESGQGDP